MICEICGSETKSFKTIVTEGTRLNVCPRCASHGTVVSSPQSRSTFRRPTYVREETVPELLDGYGKTVRTAREKRGWKQEEVARKINEPESLIHRIETGRTEPSVKTAKKLEKLFGVKLLGQRTHTAVDLKKEKPQAVTLGDIVKIRKRKHD